MKNLKLSLIVIMMFARAAFCQLTAGQKVADFLQLAGLYAKHYAAYEWKRDVIGFDLYDVKPWLDKVNASKDDLEFFDICVRYVAGLQDSHDEFALSTDFEANIPIGVDIYDGKVLINSIDRTRLPESEYPFQTGDELISVDGKKVADLIEAFLPYAANASGNATASRRAAAQTIVARRQTFFPRAPETGDSARIVVQDITGTQATYTLPWIKSGRPIWNAGPVPPLRTDREQARRNVSAVPQTPSYLLTLLKLQGGPAIGTLGSAPPEYILPLFSEPPGFKRRLGGDGDPFISGTFPVDGRYVGFLRIPTMMPDDAARALELFGNEIAFFQDNTDALVIDLMRNYGGNLCYAQSLVQRLFTTPFRGVAYRIRATQSWFNTFAGHLDDAISNHAEQWIIDLYTAYLAQVQLAMNDSRGMTGALPVCAATFEDVQPAVDKRGKQLTYSKPILLLVDDQTLSSAEAFAMMLQDGARATVLGVRTGGGGGSPIQYDTGVYSEGYTRVTETLVTRAKPVSTPAFPPADHLENVGVYPDIHVDYMTRDNLMNGGKPFVDAFSRAVANLMSAR